MNTFSLFLLSLVYFTHLTNKKILSFQTVVFPTCDFIFNLFMTTKKTLETVIETIETVETVETVKTVETLETDKTVDPRPETGAIPKRRKTSHETSNPDKQQKRKPYVTDYSMSDSTESSDDSDTEQARSPSKAFSG